MLSCLLVDISKGFWQLLVRYVASYRAFLSSYKWVSSELVCRLCGRVTFYRVVHCVTSRLSANETRRERMRRLLIFLQTSSSLLKKMFDNYRNWITSHHLNVSGLVFQYLWGGPDVLTRTENPTNWGHYDNSYHSLKLRLVSWLGSIRPLIRMTVCQWVTKWPTLLIKLIWTVIRSFI